MYLCISSGNKSQINAATYFCSGSDNVVLLKRELLHVVQNVTSCIKCLTDGVPCDLNDAETQCSKCVKTKDICTSLLIVSTSSDMAATQVKLTEDPTFKISDPKELFLRDSFYCVFGMLHQAKAITNFSRNWSITHEGHHHNVKNILSLWNSPCIIGNQLRKLLSSKVMLGKDKQNDEDSFNLSAKLVQDTLANANWYVYQLVPDTNFKYTDASVAHRKLKSICSLVPRSIKEELLYLIDPVKRCIWVANNATIPKITPVCSKLFGSINDATYTNDILLVTDTVNMSLLAIQYSVEPTEEKVDTGRKASDKNDKEGGNTNSKTKSSRVSKQTEEKNKKGRKASDKNDKEGGNSNSKTKSSRVSKQTEEKNKKGRKASDKNDKEGGNSNSKTKSYRASKIDYECDSPAMLIDSQDLSYHTSNVLILSKSLSLTIYTLRIKKADKKCKNNDGRNSLSLIKEHVFDTTFPRNSFFRSIHISLGEEVFCISKTGIWILKLIPEVPTYNDQLSRNDNCNFYTTDATEVFTYDKWKHHYVSLELINNVIQRKKYVLDNNTGDLRLMYVPNKIDIGTSICRNKRKPFDFSIRPFIKNN